jgi:hypothetical protein
MRLPRIRFTLSVRGLMIAVLLLAAPGLRVLYIMGTGVSAKGVAAKGVAAFGAARPKVVVYDCLPANPRLKAPAVAAGPEIVGRASRICCASRCGIRPSSPGNAVCCKANFVWPNWLTYAFFYRARPTLAGALNAQGKNGGKWRFFRWAKPPFFVRRAGVSVNLRPTRFLWSTGL